MSFVPVTGRATFRPADPPRESVVEFTDERRTVSLPIRAALPGADARRTPATTCTRASGCSRARRCSACGWWRPASSSPPGPPPSWRMAPLDDADDDRVRMLAGARADGAGEAADAEQVVRQVLDAVADAMPRSAPVGAGARRRRRRAAPGTGYSSRLQERLAQRVAAATDDRPQLVRISLRVEADEEELVAGAVRLVLQVHDEQDPLHVCDAARAVGRVGPGRAHGFGDRARTHATIALRAAADAWPVLDRLLELRVPDQITLDTDELVSLLDDGVGALQRARRRRALAAQPRPRPDRDDGARPHARRPRGPADRGACSAPTRCSRSTGRSPCTATRSPRRRWTSWPAPPRRSSSCAAAGRSSTPSIARKARKRLVRTVKPAQAVAAALTGVVQVDPRSTAPRRTAGRGRRLAC